MMFCTAFSNSIKCWAVPSRFISISVPSSSSHMQVSCLAWVVSGSCGAGVTKRIGSSLGEPRAVDEFEFYFIVGYFIVLYLKKNKYK